MNGRLAGAFLAGLVVLAGLPAWSQGTPPVPTPSATRAPTTPTRFFTIRGHVRFGATERAAEMVKIDLKRFTGEVVMTTFTRSNGEFEFTGLSGGMYYLVVEERGFEPIRQAVEIFGTSRLSELLYLVKPLQFNAGEPGETVSAHELTLPRKARDALHKGRQRLEKKDAQGSLAHFQRAVTEAPGYYEAYHQMGIAYLELGQNADAENAFRKSIEVSLGRYADAHFALGLLLSNVEKFSDAEMVIRRGLDVDSGAWQGHYELARALLGLNRLDEAEKSIDEARTRKPDFSQLHLVSANIHIRKGDPIALLRDLDEFLKLEPNGPQSDQARQTRETVQRGLTQAQQAPAAKAPRP